VQGKPWRYDRDAYEAALGAAQALAPLTRLAGEAAQTPWDPDLASAMRHHNLRVEEELVIDTLLADLRP
jgi:hypothetical protein